MLNQAEFSCLLYNSVVKGREDRSKLQGSGRDSTTTGQNAKSTNNRPLLAISRPPRDKNISKENSQAQDTEETMA